ncbi:MAG TPA: DUF3343 domain-containing protein [Candidatus Desulfofervidus auxilii]|uniref:DUF3343 domain-containing protein n=1 Tax=Desulfofervidus auxilii TaxID=1621989 RepID=A0A7V0IAH0_DESA2|nr:DUF3343 domain-containing protein [Candidatus Desulfofervidus auxilii]
MFKRLKEKFLKKKVSKTKGLILVENVAIAMAVETLLKEHNFFVRGVAPPPHLRKGCDLAVEFDLVEQMGIERVLKRAKIVYEIASLSTDERPLELTKMKEIDGYILVRAANMKLTFDPKTGIVVNVSGGGCPDVPFLSKKLIGKHLREANEVIEDGYSLCAYMLKKALRKAQEIYKC